MIFNPEKRYETNPFVDVNAITTRKKKVVIRQGNDILLNHETGEASTTNVITYREVDDEQFSKVNPKLHMAYVTFRKGLNELVKSQILAKSKRMGIIL